MRADKRRVRSCGSGEHGRASVLGVPASPLERYVNFGPTSVPLEEKTRNGI
jgi:hypothetical protein